MTMEPQKYRDQRATRALIDLGMKPEDTKRLRRIQKNDEWDDLSALVRYILREYAPPEEIDHENP